MKETSKCFALREGRGDFVNYLNGTGLDIGSGDDMLMVPRGTVTPWDKPNGDAQFLKSLPADHFDFVYSSHCLEHMVSIETALHHWVRVLKPDGWLYIVVPDYTLYEHHIWPSYHNPDHNHSFSIQLTREKVRRSNHWHIEENLVPLLNGLDCPVKSAELEDLGYNYNLGHKDQTLGSAIAQLCIISRKLV